LEWIWAHTPCRRIVTNVPEDNRLAYQFALAGGMEVYGRNEASVLKRGRLVDQICLGISRPRELPLFEASEVPIPDVLRPVAASTGLEEG
jgi:hypothetical protein